MRLNPLAPALPNYPGPFRVGTVQLEVPVPKEYQKTFGAGSVRTLLVRLFYPTSATRGSRPRWVGAGGHAVAGYAHFLGISETALGAASWLGLKWTDIPAFQDTPLLCPPSYLKVPQSTSASSASSVVGNGTADTHDNTSGRWPAMIFSHGLGGTRNAYSQISGSIASGGVVCMSIEHRDHSAAISVVQGVPGEREEEVVRYVSIKESTPATIQARRDQLEQRAYEVKLGIELFRALDAAASPSSSLFTSKSSSSSTGSSIFPADVVQGLNAQILTFAASLDVAPGRILMAGHSFGAATGVHCAKHETGPLVSTDGPKYTLRSEFRALVLLDPWTEVLVDSTARKLSIPTLAVASEAFHKWSSNWRAVLELLSHDTYVRNGNANGTANGNGSGNGSGSDKARGMNRLLWIPESAHLSQSDFGLLFPTATKYAFKAALNPSVAMDLNIRAVREFLRETVGVRVPARLDASSADGTGVGIGHEEVQMVSDGEIFNGVEGVRMYSKV